MDKKIAPELRFDGFTEPWEEKRLTDFGCFYSGLTYSPMDIVKSGGTLVLRSSNVQSGEISLTDNVYVDNHAVNSENVNFGDIVIVVRNGSRSLIGKHATVKTPLTDTVIGAFMAGYRTPNYKFVNALLDTSNFKQEVDKNLGATINQITNGMFSVMSFPVPYEAEMKPIGHLFCYLDSLISQQEKKCAVLGEARDALLDKMFPKEGETEPELRFEGFTGPWEQRKLGDLLAESDERSSTEEILSVSVANGIYPASESDRDTNPGASIANYKIVRVGDIVYNSMRMWQGAVGSSRYNGIVSPAYVVAKPVVELDSTCFGYLLKRPEMLYKYLCESQGNSKDTQTLRYERFAEITAEIPSTIEEQRAISDCLASLDSLITLHQRKYEKLRTLKSAMLDKMFPKGA